MSEKHLTIGILGSGSGTNFEAIAEAVQKGRIPRVRIGVVISDRPDAPILEKAKRFKIRALYIPPGRYKTWLEPQVEGQYVRALQERGVDWVVLAGFMRVVKQPLLKAFENRVINIHPSLLPAFPGIRAWAQALEAGVKATGCTVHFVNDKIDAGPVILQEAVEICDGDTPETLHARIQEKEHGLYPKAIALIAQGRLSIQGGRVMIRNADI